MASAGELTARITLGGMDTVERQLRSFSTAMDRASEQASSMGRTLREAGEGFNELGENIAPLSAGLVAIGGASVAASDNINQAVNQFKTKLGASGADLENYKGHMEEVGKTGVGSFEEVSDGIITVSKNMKGLSDGDLNSVTTEAMQLANVMDSDVGEVSKTAGQLMSQFGISGSQAMDMIAKGYQEGMDYAGDYQDTLNEYSVYFKNLGFDADDMFNTLISGANAGAFNLDKVGDAVKEFGIRSKDGSDTSKQAFKDLGLDADKMTATFAKGGEGAKKGYAQVVNALAGVKDQTERNAIGVSLFGTQYEDMEKDVISATGSMEDHMKGYGGTASKMAKDNINFAQEMQGAWNQIQIAIKPVGDVLRGAISDVMPTIVSAIQSMSNAFMGLSPNMQKVVLAVGAFVAFLPVMLVGVGGILSVLGTMATGWGAVARGFSLVATGGTKLISAIKMIGTAFRALSAIFMANPFLLIVAGIVVVAVLIYKYWDQISAYTIAAWNAIKAWFAPFWEFLKALVSAFVAAFMAYIKTVIAFWTSVWNGIKTVFIAIWSGLSAFFSSIWSNLTSVVTTVFNAIKTVIKVAWDAIKTIFLIAIGLLVTILSPLWNAFATGWNALVGIVKTVMNKVKSWVKAAITIIQNLWLKYSYVVRALWMQIYSSYIKPVVDRIKSVISTLIGKAKQVMNAVKSAFKVAWDAIYKVIVKPAITFIKNFIKGLIIIAKAVMSAVKSAFSTAWNAIKVVVTKVISVIKNVIQGLTSKVSSVTGKVKSFFVNAFNAIKSKVSSSISSVKDKISSIWNTAKSIAGKIKDAFSGIFKSIKIPHFSLGGWSVKDLPKLPKMSVSWHAKGGILNSSTLIGAGEKGAEAIVPLSSQRRMKPFAQAVSKFMPEGTKGGSNTSINVAQMVVREEADIQRIAQELNRLQDKKERAKGRLSFV
ncbi:phage tail tape measure protein [Bacillus atrophaeus]|uniref:phage tail tape measure protein n=1 Tax=Bacillus atrophaeus TaxID=1452 RepID=UPI002E1A64EE|nr:phage tail tape measure protein [Bacillus atrophaeus]